MACHSVVQMTVRSTNVHLVVRVMIMAKVVKHTGVAVWLIELDILFCTHYMVR
jgi:hypothetical protein